MRAAMFLASTVIVLSPAVAQDVPKPAISVDTLKSVTQTLSSDAYEGRAPATPAEDKTAAYIVERFKQAGLKPGNKGKWFQDVPLVEITASDVTPLTVTGGKAPVSAEYR